MSFHPYIVIGGIYFKCALYRPLLFRLWGKVSFPKFLSKLYYTLQTTMNMAFAENTRNVYRMQVCAFLSGICRLELFCYIFVTNNKSSFSIPMFIITDGWSKLQAPLSMHRVCSPFQLSLVAFIKIPNFILFLDTM